MDILISNLALGFGVAMLPANLLLCFVGAMIGTLIGVLPGIGPVATIAMLLPATYGLPPEGAIIMLAGIYYGAMYGGSTTAILVNMPGESASVITALDGFKMAQQGRAGPALAVAALGSLFAGVAATLVVATLSAPLSSLALMLGPAEYVSLMVLGFIFAVVLAQGSLVKALVMIVLGVLLSTIGTDPETGTPRFMFGLLELSEGLDFAVVAMGLFGLAEIIRNIETPIARDMLAARIGRLWPTGEDFRRAVPAVIRGTALGSLLGVLPGGGVILSSSASYAVEKRLSRSPARFGEGAIEGVAGPESANNAASQTSFIPLLNLGIPSNAVMALMVGALAIHGIVPGPQIMTAQPGLFWGLVASMLIGNLMLVVINLPMVGLWVKLLDVPYRLLFPAILLFCAIGVYSLNNSPFDVVLTALFGLLGYLLVKGRFEPAPLIFGLILGPIFEYNFRRALLLSRGDALVFVQRPISLLLLLVAVALLVIAALPFIRARRARVFVE